MAPFKGIYRPVLVCLCLIGLSACATASSPEGMSVAADATASAVPGSKSDHGFRLGQVNGGSATSAIGLSDVSNEDLRAALTNSLRSLGYLAADDSKASYVVSVDIIDLDRPFGTLDPVFFLVPIESSVTARIRYTVTPVGGGRPVFDDVIATTGSSADAATPAGRVRKANEAAVRMNIVAFLNRLKKDWK